MAVRDPETEWLRVQIYRCMTPAERVGIAARTYENAISLVRSSILKRTPSISPEDLEHEVRRAACCRAGWMSSPKQREGRVADTERDALFQVLDAPEALQIMKSPRLTPKHSSCKMAIKMAIWRAP
jgi:hypothetical protein